MTDEKEYSQNEVNIMTDEMIALRKEYERAAFRRGAEAMRVAVTKYLLVTPRAGGMLISIESSSMLAYLSDDVSALPTPEYYTDAP